MSDVNNIQSSEQRQRALLEQIVFLGQVASTETDLLHQAAAAKAGLGVTDMKTVSVLLQEGSMTAGQLAQRLNLTTGAVTNVIDRLELRGLVKRAPDPKDRRKVIVTANQKRLAVSGNSYRSVGEALERLLASYSGPELEFLVEHYRASIDITRQEIAKLR